MKLIPRDYCLFTGSSDRELLHSFAQCPVRMGCTEQPPSEDIFADMNWWIFPKSGSIQLNPLIPTELLYGLSHNEAIGEIWRHHHGELADFIFRFCGKSVLELGGATGLLAGNILEKSSAPHWTLLDANPALPAQLAERIPVIHGFVREASDLRGDWDTIVHSHFLEHFYEPLDLFKKVSAALSDGQRHIFSLPNMRALLESGYSNCLNFEHTCFLHEGYVDWMLAREGFRVLEKRYFRNHSIFFATEKCRCNYSIPCPNLYAENNKLFQRFLDNNREAVQSLNRRISEASDASIYLFGAHVFSQFLIAFGLDTARINGLLDNSPTKQGKRLSGTPLNVSSPSVLRNRGRVYVILRAANYNEEIKTAIWKSHNQDVEFWE